MGGYKYNPEKDIGSLEGKVILVTGGNNGLGLETILQLAKHKPKNIFLCARTRSKAEEALKTIQTAVPGAPVTLLDMDLASFASVKEAADSFKQQSDRLDVLINNAGVMMMPPSTTTEGYDVQWGTNHMGHYLLTKLLLPTLERTAAEPGSDVRIINLSSSGNAMAPTGGIVFADTALAKANSVTRYGQSKLANILFSKSLALKHPRILSVSLHPGVVDTGLTDGFAKNNPLLRPLVWFFGSLTKIPVAEGAKNQLWCATAPRDKVKNGAFYYPVGQENQGKAVYTQDAKLAEKLWTYSEEEMAKHGFGGEE